MVRSGYHGTTMAQISKASGLPIGSLYWHFRNKEEVFAALIEYCFEDWQVRHRGDSNRELLFESIGLAAANSGADAPTEEAFWNIGLLLALERRMGENAARRSYLSVRERMFELMVAKVEADLPAEALAADPQIAQKVVVLGRALTDGFYVAAAAGDDIDFAEAAELSARAMNALVTSIIEESR